MSDGEALVWVPALIYPDGYSLKLWPGFRHPERFEGRVRTDALLKWITTHGDGPRKETVKLDETNYEGVYLKWVKWELASETVEGLEAGV